MPVPIGHYTHTYTSLLALPSTVWDALRSNAQNANVILPHASKHLEREKAGGACVPGQCWIVCGPCGTTDIDFIISCTQGPLGTYPVFIYATRPFDELVPAYLSPRLPYLVRELAAQVPHHRVYSVFGPEPAARLFVELWTAHTGISAYADYYRARITHCTLKSFVDRRTTCFPGIYIDLRLAKESDILPAAELCYRFSTESSPFVLSYERAIEEARMLYLNNQLWVHAITRAGEETELASIVATSRESETVSCVTKVFTNPRWRQRGCAQRLVRHVCKHLLNVEAKKSVVLYVANDNHAASRVYQRVGFVGLDDDEGLVQGVDQWVEIGLDRSKVVLGHW